MDEREKPENKPENMNIILAKELKAAADRDEKIMAEEDLPMPIKPNDVSRDEITDTLKTLYAKVRKPLGDPILFFDLVEEPGSISNTNLCST